MSRLALALVAVWPALAIPGFAVLAQHATTPGQGADAPATWPADAPFTRAPGRPALVMLAHPRCPCTRASLAELARVMGATGGGLDAWVLFLDPHEGDDAWRTSDLWSTARGIPGVHALPDADGVLAARFGAHTSGQVVVYDTDGTLAFAGGLTAGRGHEGPSDGRSRLIDGVLHGFHPDAGATPVFGCALQAKDGDR